MPRREDLLDGSVRIHFDAPILHHAEPRGFMTLRPPTFGEVLAHGEPQSLVVGNGAGVTYVDRPLLVKWFSLLLTDHAAEFIQPSRDAALALLVEEVIFGFFTGARTRLRPPPAPSSPEA